MLFILYSGGSIRIPYSVGRQDCDKKDMPDRKDLFIPPSATRSAEGLAQLFGLSLSEGVALDGKSVHVMQSGDNYCLFIV